MVDMDKCGVECEVYSHTFGKCYYEDEIRKDAIEQFAKWLVEHMFNGQDNFWKGDSVKPLHMADYIAEYEKEENYDKF